MYVGSWTLTRTYSCTVRGWPMKHKQSKPKPRRCSKRRQHLFPAQAAVLLTSEDPRTRLRCRGAHTPYPTCRQCVQAKSLLKSSAESISHFIKSGQPLSLPFLGESRTTTA